MRVSFFLEVTSLDRSIEFYTKELGLFKVGGERYYGPATLAEMARIGDVFLEYIEAPNIDVVLRRKQSIVVPPDDKMILETKAVDGLYQRLRISAVAANLDPLGMISSPVGILFWISDPDGYRLQITNASTPP